MSVDSSQPTEENSRADAPPPAGVADAFVNRRVGSYRILRLLGHGASGAVYLAARDDGEFQQHVAVKTVRRGADAAPALRRFRNERQILAELDHPHIARLLDGGTTDDGISFFVMEYVKGEPLDVYCDNRRLTVPDRLRLFCRVGGAVGYAHRSGVIHRDIKPSNICVTATGEPKLLEFGVAKAFAPQLASDTFASDTSGATAARVRFAVHEYVSPEQAQALTVTPASDIYSLGVVLYELLTGRSPYGVRADTPEALARLICEQEPLSPSEAVRGTTTGSSAARAARLADARAQTPEGLSRELAGNLDRILLKALHKDPAHRFASAEDFCGEIARHLDHRPAPAPPSVAAPTAAGTKYQARAETAIGERSLAVLPLRLTGTAGNTGDAYLGVGLADALITRLGGLRRFVVRSTSSVLRFGAGGNAEHVDPFAAGRELGVEFVLEGRITRAGNRIRVRVQLLDVRAGTACWGGQFDEEFTDVLSLEDHLSEQVAGALVPHLSGDERAQLARHSTDRAEALEAYLRGRYHWNSMSVDGFAKAAASYRRAVALDPSYAAAHSALAEYHCWLAIYGLQPPAACLAAAREAAGRAVALDDAEPSAHVALGLALLTHETQWEMAGAHFRRALELKPHDTQAHALYAWQLGMEGDFDAAVKEARAARDLDPLNPFNMYVVAWLLYQARRYDESIKEARALLQSEPRLGSAFFVLSWTLRQTGAHDEACAAAERAIEYVGDVPMFRLALAAAEAEAQRPDKARASLAALQAQSTQRFITPYHRALVHLALDETETSLSLLEEAVAINDPWVTWLGTEPQLDRLRDDPRFIELLRRTHHPALRPGDPGPARVEPNSVARSITATSGRRLLFAAGASLALFVFAVVVFILLRPSSQPRTVGGLVRLTNHLANDWHPEFSPDGERLVAVSNRDGRTEIYTLNTDGSDWRRLTSNTVDDDCPTWSPDGKRIAFQSKRDGQVDIYVMNADGSEQVNVTKNPADDLRPSWSPDGTMLVFSGNRLDATTDFNIYTIRADGTDRRLLAAAPGADVDPAWSPDGSRIAFSSDRDNKSYEIYTMRPDGTDLRNLTNTPGNEVKPAWSPDGTRLVFAGNRPGKNDLAALYLMNADGSRQQLFTDTTTYDDEPAWSPDGRRIAFQSHRDGNAELYLADVNPAGAPRPAAPATTTQRSLAVLPLRATGQESGDEEQYLGVGLADLLARKLGQLESVATRPLGAVRPYLNLKQSALDAGRELRVDYVLAGTVEQSDGQVRTKLELTDVRRARPLWSEAFDAPSADIFNLQSRIAERVLRSLQISITGDEQARLRQPHTANNKAYQLYLAGNYHFEKRTPEDLRLAITAFNNAVREDRNFAFAYAGLANAHLLLNLYQIPPPDGAYVTARQHAERALSLNGELAEAHAALAHVRFCDDRDHNAAVQGLRRAVELDPSYATAHHWLSLTLSASKQHDEALREILAAEQINPRSAIIKTAVGLTYFYARRYDEALTYCERALALDAGFLPTHKTMRWIHQARGDYDRALASFQKELDFADGNLDDPSWQVIAAQVEALSGRRDNALAYLQRALAARSVTNHPNAYAYEIALAHSALGDRDRALAWLTKADTSGNYMFNFASADPRLDGSRAEKQ